MNTDFLKRILRTNWHVLLVMLGIVGVAIYQAFTGTAEPARQSASSARSGGEAVRRAPVAATAPVIDAAAAQKASRREMAMAAIQENEAALASATDSESAAACINGIANLYFQRLQDYEAASGYYERVLSEHGNAPCVYQAFVNLALCYERLDQPEKRTSVLRRMLTKFPEDSQEYAYAYSELYGTLPKGDPIAAAGISGETTLELARAQESPK